jgi:hypothetical protein
VSKKSEGDNMKYVLFVTAILSLFVLSSFAMADTVTIRPDGMGNYNAWTNVGYTAATEYMCVNEAAANTSAYLWTSSKSVSESFTFSNVGLSGVTINNVTLWYYGQRYSSTRYRFQPLIRSGGTNYLGAVKSLTSSYAYYSQVYTTNPAIGSAWTVAEVNALEAGMKSYSSSYGGKIAQMYAVIDYSYQDSCSDTDGGNYAWLYGTTSGYLGGAPYSNNDYCVDASNVNEYYCSGTSSQSSQQSCGTDGYTFSYCNGNSVYHNYTDYYCSGGVCGVSLTPELQESCNSSDGYYGDNYCMSGNVYRDYRNYYCSGGACSYTNTPTLQETCAYGCSGGACNPYNSCSDSDGFEPFVAGNVTGYYYGYPYTFQDSCGNSTMVTEYLCSGSAFTYSNISCILMNGTGCSNGACY